MSTIQSDVVLDVSGGKALAAPAGWTVVHAPNAATQAIATKSAGGTGVKHVCTGIIATVAAGANAQTPLTVQLLDGASTVVLSATLSAPVNGCGVLAMTDLNIVGTAATAMTLQFTAAGAAATLECCTLIGYDVA